MYGLVDCNNFYASCERAFQPKLREIPIVVLSNNDGCVIARSDEAKSLGIKMGAPAFLMEELIKKNRIEVFSSNYTLYNDMSWRVMDSLSELCPITEVYSIDEAFLGLHELKSWDLEKYAVDVRRKVIQWSKIPVSIGIAPSKTLAKIANKLAKKNKNGSGLYLIDTEDKRKEALSIFPIEDVWGIGRQHAKRLMDLGVKSALDFTTIPEDWVNKNMSVVGWRMIKELKGISTIGMNPPRDVKKGISTTRSFGSMLSDLPTMAEAVATHAHRCAEKLREQKSCAGILTVFVHTNQFREDLPQYARSYVYKLPVPTNHSGELIAESLKGLEKIFKQGFQYKKAGVICTGLVPETEVQTNMFDTADREKQMKANKVMDSLNAILGKDTVRLAAQGFNKTWKIKQEKLSPCYTTNSNDVPIALCH